MSLYTTYSDEELANFLQKDNEKAFTEIYARYREALANYAISLTNSYDDAHDVLQDIFSGIWLQRHSLEISISLKAYLFTAVRNRCLRQIENKARQDRLQKELLQRFDALATALFPVETKELDEAVRQIIDTMPERMRQVYLLSRNQGLSHREIAEQLNITENTAKKQVQKALQLIRGSLRPSSHTIIVILLSFY